MVYLPLWKMMEFVSWDDDIPNIWKNKTCSKPPTSQSCPIIVLGCDDPTTKIATWWCVKIPMKQWKSCMHEKNKHIIIPWCKKSTMRGWLPWVLRSLPQRPLGGKKHACLYQSDKLGRLWTCVIQMLAENSGSWLETQLFAAQIHHAGLVASNISDPFFLILLNTLGNVALVFLSIHFGPHTGHNEYFFPVLNGACDTHGWSKLTIDGSLTTDFSHQKSGASRSWLLTAVTAGIQLPLMA